MSPRASPAGHVEAAWEADRSVLYRTVMRFMVCLTSLVSPHPLRVAPPVFVRTENSLTNAQNVPFTLQPSRDTRIRGKTHVRGRFSCLKERAFRELRLTSAHTGLLWPPFLLKIKPSSKQTLPSLAFLNRDCLYKY